MYFLASRAVIPLPLRHRTIPSLVVLLLLLCAVHPSHPVGAGDPYLLNGYALDLLQKGESEKALEQLQKASSLFPYDLTLRRNLAEVYTLIGQRRMESGRFEEAATSFDNARELFPEVQRYTVLRGVALYSSKQYDAAIIELERARGLGRDTADILYFLGRAHYDSGNLQTAVESWEKALELDRERKDIAELAAKGRKELAVEGSMGKEFSSRFVVSYDEGDRSDLADKVLDHLETAYNRVGADFSHFPTARIPVLIYTRKDYRTLTNSPDWSGGLYDGKIRLPIGGTTELNAILKATLYHEYTHVVIQDITNGHTPTWLNEGLAELQGRREFAHPLIDLELAVKNRSVLPLSSIQKGFGKLSAKDAALAYQQSYSMAKYLVSTYGWHKAKDILMLLGSGKAASTAFAEALADLSVDYQSFYQEWLASVEKEYVR